MRFAYYENVGRWGGAVRLAISAGMLLAATLLPHARVVQATVTSNPPAPALLPAPPPLLAQPWDIQITNWTIGQGVDGWIASGSSTFDPTAQDYPATIPPNFGHQPEGFAGLINAATYDGSETLQLYCIDINTDTWGGITYNLGTWSGATVPRVGFITNILNEYYPHNPNNPDLAGLSASQQAAAVQAAIWYFSDRYVLDPNDPIRPYTEAIVNHVRNQPPAPTPQPPSLTITPPSTSGPAGTLVGPFTVTSTGGTGQITVSASSGASMFGAPAGSTPIADDTQVPSGAQIWLESASPGSAQLFASDVATVPRGNVYLHSGDPTANQRLIISDDARLTSTASATAQFVPAGSLVINKIIAGDGAQRQGQITILTTCAGTTLDPFVIPAGTVPSTLTKTYNGLTIGASCTIAETGDGSDESVTNDITASVDGGTPGPLPVTVTIPDPSTNGGVVSVNVTDTINLIPTPTPTVTVTPTVSVTPTVTETPTVTPSATPTETSTPLPTNTPTSTPTSTPVPTNTPTVTPTSTPSATPTDTPTPLPTNTPTNTPTGRRFRPTPRRRRPPAPHQRHRPTPPPAHQQRHRPVPPRIRLCRPIPPPARPFLPIPW